jgi:hypothetical protein
MGEPAPNLEQRYGQAYMPGPGEPCPRLRGDPSDHLRQQGKQRLLAYRSSRVARVPSVFLGVVLLSSALWASDSANSVSTANAESGSSADAVVTRYTAELEQMSHPADCRTVAVEIEAALPKHGKRARLLAIRHSPHVGGPEYEVLQVEGDRSVRQQVIARYISAQVQADSLPRSSVAVTPANYKFRHARSIVTAGTLTYVFQVTPRRKQVGLMKGELWVDAATGLAVHQVGRMVKNPSIFLRRIDVTRDTSIRDGAPDLRVTHLDIDTRLVGHAELTIKERPCTPQSALAIARLVPNAGPSGPNAVQGTCR